jgi:hypothetical protein
MFYFNQHHLTMATYVPSQSHFRALSSLSFFMILLRTKSVIIPMLFTQTPILNKHFAISDPFPINPRVCSNHKRFYLFCLLHYSQPQFRHIRCLLLAIPPFAVHTICTLPLNLFVQLSKSSKSFHPHFIFKLSDRKLAFRSNIISS